MGDAAVRPLATRQCRIEFRSFAGLASKRRDAECSFKRLTDESRSRKYSPMMTILRDEPMGKVQRIDDCLPAGVRLADTGKHDCFS